MLYVNRQRLFAHVEEGGNPNDEDEAANWESYDSNYGSMNSLSPADRKKEIEPRKHPRNVPDGPDKKRDVAFIR